MSAVAKNAVTGFKTAMEALTPTTDAGARSTYKHLPKGQVLDRFGRDRVFVVEYDGGNTDQMTGEGGQKYAHGDVTVRVLFANEGRAVVDFSALIAEDVSIIQDYVPVWLRRNISGVRSCYPNGDARVSRSIDEPTRYLAEIPFRFHYVDTHVSP